jgi:GNAT superfamily N-acetyltransferase
VLGYYTLSATNALITDIPDEYVSGFPRYPIPCVLIGRLAVDKTFQKKRCGTYMLFDSLKRTKEVSKQIGCFAVIVNALNDQVVKWYEKYGFIKYKVAERNLFLPIDKIP